MSSVYTGANTYHTSITIPSDGDLRNVLSINPALQALEDDVTYLFARTNGAFRNVGLLSSGINEAANAEADAQIGSNNTTTSQASLEGIGTMSNCANGDILEGVVSGTLQVVGNTSNPFIGYLRVYANQNGAGAAAIANAVASTVATTSGVPAIVPFSISYYLAISNAGGCALSLFGRVSASGGTNAISILGSFQNTARLWRQN